MKLGLGIVIFFLSLVALVAEIALYFIVGIGAAVGGAGSSVSGVAAFFVWLMFMTAITGIAAPIAGAIEQWSKVPNRGFKILFATMFVGGVGIAGIMALGYHTGTGRPIAPGPSATSNAGSSPATSAKWQPSESISAMDGSKTVILHLPAENEIKGWLKSESPNLVVRCQEGKIEVYVDTKMSADVEYGRDTHTVRVRLDEAKPFTEHWTSSTDHQALFAPRADQLMKQIAHAKTMLFEFTPFQASRAQVEFDVRGLDEYLPKIEEARSSKKK